MGINKDYAAKRHRDNNNIGMTVLRGLGDYTGGQVKHWPQDPGRHELPDVEELAAEEAVVSDTKCCSVCIDSTKAHEVMPFSGKRYSLVYFTIPRFESSPEDVRQFLLDKCDLSIPKHLHAAEELWQRARESAPGGPLFPTPVVTAEALEEAEMVVDDAEDEPEDPLTVSAMESIPNATEEETNALPHYLRTFHLWMEARKGRKHHQIICAIGGIALSG